jgi:LuxR family maltose regulon positive regulatory protein
MLATRAADLLERQGDIDGALQQALAAGDRPRAAALVGREAVRLGFDGRAGVLARRVNLLDEQTFAEQPDAAIARAWLGLTTGDADMIQRSLVMASHADAGQPLSDGTPSVKVAAALVGSVVGAGGIAEVVRHADVVRAAGDHLVNPWWGAAMVMKGAAMSMIGEPAQARVLLAAALPVVTDLPGFHAAALAHLALLDLGAADAGDAVERSLAAREIADRADLCDVVPMVVVYAASAVTSARIGDRPAARAAVAATERLLGRLGNLAAEVRLLPHLATHLSLQRIADELMLSRETVKSQATSIYRKLDVSSRTAAVAEAKRVGLLTN